MSKQSKVWQRPLKPGPVNVWLDVEAKEVISRLKENNPQFEIMAYIRALIKKDGGKSVNNKKD